MRKLFLITVTFLFASLFFICASSIREVKAETFNIVIQPQGTQSKDVRVAYTDAGPYVNTNYNGSNTLIVGAGVNKSIPNYYNKFISRILIQFDLSIIPLNAEIVQAELQLFCSPPMPLGPVGLSRQIASITVDLHKIIEPWDAGDVTWSSQPEFEEYPESTTEIGHPMGWYAWDIVNLVQYWYDDPLTNDGVLLKLANEDTLEEGLWAVRYFAASEDDMELSYFNIPSFGRSEYNPKLVVTYEY